MLILATLTEIRSTFQMILQYGSAFSSKKFHVAAISTNQVYVLLTNGSLLKFGGVIIANKNDVFCTYFLYVIYHSLHSIHISL